MTFGELVESLGKSLGVELSDEGGATGVEVDGSPVALYAAGEDLLLMLADLGEVAPGDRERVFAAAMEANFLYQGTGGSSLAVDPRSGRLHLQKYNWLGRIDAEKAMADLTRFADAVKTWRGLLSESSARAAASDGDVSAPLPGGFMQV